MSIDFFSNNLKIHRHNNLLSQLKLYKEDCLDKEMIERTKNDDIFEEQYALS